MSLLYILILRLLNKSLIFRAWNVNHYEFKSINAIQNRKSVPIDSRYFKFLDYRHFSLFLKTLNFQSNEQLHEFNKR